ncbi:MAG: hemerythrin domain-containing protein [bacterium]|nr:hemerythrin domain-containing protein [bacterium]
MARRRRHPSLVPLSHDHRDALGLAFRLRHPAPPGPVTAMTPASTPASRAAETLAFWDRHLVGHFAAEETLLFPFLRTHLADAAPLLDALVAEHRTLAARRDAVATAADAGGPALDAALLAFGEELERHVRREERELFEHFPDVAADDGQRLADAIREALPPRPATR